MHGDWNDERLMLAYRTGDTEAFTALYRRHRGPLYRYMLQQCGNAGVAAATNASAYASAICGIEKPRVGLWERDYAVAVFESCVKNGREKEPPIDISEQCKCWVGKVSQLVTQEQAQAQNVPDSEVQALSEKSLAECMR